VEIKILFVIILILSSSFLSAAETAITTAHRGKIRRLGTNGNKRARLVYGLIQEKELFITTILMLNTIANIFCSSFATEVFLNHYTEHNLAWFALLMSLIILFFAEILPKTIAITNPSKISLMVGYPIHLSVRLLKPLVGIMLKFSNGFLRILRINLEKEKISIGDSIKGIISLHTEDKTTKEYDLNMLNSIVELSETKVREVMVHRTKIFSVDIDLDPREFVQKILSGDYTKIPVWQDNPNNIVGVVYSRDMLRLLQTSGHQINANSIHSIVKKACFIYKEVKLSQQLHHFRMLHKHVAFIIDEFGTLQGMLTLADILDEIVGHIINSDEDRDKGYASYEKIDKKTIIIKANTTVRDLNREMQWNIPDEYATTISGFIIHHLKRFPKKGEVFRFKTYSFVVLSTKDNVIDKVRISIINKTSK